MASSSSSSSSSSLKRLMKYGSCRSLSEKEGYGRLTPIGRGTYGVVFKATKDTQSDTQSCRRKEETVALKKVLMHNQATDGFPLTTLREIRMLRLIDHPNCIKLLDVIIGESQSIYLVFDYCEHDLGTLLQTNKIRFSESEVKTLTIQLLQGLGFIHALDIIHRDIKLSNLLYNNRGQLKICDFGLARIAARGDMTNNVVTLWYRAPELLLGCTGYSSSIDIWSCACILAELYLGRPIFPGNDEMDQIKIIFSCLGAPRNSIWPDVEMLPLIQKGLINLRQDQLKFQFNNLRIVFPSISDSGLQLFLQLLAYDPNKRLSAVEASHHEYFSSTPLPQNMQLMPTFKSLHQ